MKRKIAFHPKFISIFIILILVGVIVSPSFNSLDITKPSYNILNEETDKYSDLFVKTKSFFSIIQRSINNLNRKCNCSENSENLQYPERICLCIELLMMSYGLIIILPLIKALDEGKITLEQATNIWVILILPLTPVYLLWEALECESEWPHWWADPWS